MTMESLRDRLTDFDLLKIARRSRNVTRGHNLGFVEHYSLESHILQTIVLLRFLFTKEYINKDTFSHLSVYRVQDELLVHDHGELLSGDIPYHTKLESGDLKPVLVAIEEKNKNHILENIDILSFNLKNSLSIAEKSMVDFIDILEFAIRAKEDISSNPMLEAARHNSRRICHSIACDMKEKKILNESFNTEFFLSQF